MIGEGEQIVYEFTIGKRYRELKFFVWLVLLATISVTIGIFLGARHPIFLGVSGVFFLLLLINTVYYLFYLPQANAYALTTKRILIHRGWLNRHTTSINYDQVTDVSIIQTFFERILANSGTVRINTAGTGVHEVILNHIENPYEVKKKLGEIS